MHRAGLMHHIDHRYPAPSPLPLGWRHKIRDALARLPGARSVRVDRQGGDILVTIGSVEGWDDAARGRADRAIAAALKPRSPRKPKE